MLQLLVFILYTASLTGISEQAVLTCSDTGGDASIPGLSISDVRIVDGFSPSSSNLVFYGSAQTLTVIDGETVDSTELGVCYSTSTAGCYKSGVMEDCDNFIRGVIDLDGNCTNTDCSVLVCGTNALLPRCTICHYDGSSLNCNFVENDPEQNLPFDPILNSNYNSCSSENIDGVGIFQFRRNDNATFLHENGKLYYGLLKADNARNSIIGLASIDTSSGLISGEVTTRTDSQKVVATEAHFLDKPFIIGEFAYFLFREPAQEFASLSQGQTPQIDKYYSRIARICKDDEGVSVSSTLILTSFLKQRLMCSHEDENSEKLEFNEIQDFVVDEELKTIHAIFTSARDDAPLSALCVFNLTEIDETFNTGNFFGADGGTTNDRWRVNDGSSITIRPGLDCSNPNTANTNFQRDYNLMEDPALQTNVPIFLEGDRFSKLLNGSDDMYIIASERGCLYSVPVGSNITERGVPCQDPMVRAPIEDLEMTNDSLLVTANDNVDMYMYSNCRVELAVEETTDNLSPPSGTHMARPNGVFEVIYNQIIYGSPTIKQGDMKITDSNDLAYLLIKHESLDTADSLMHLSILILNYTKLEFPNEPDLDYIIETYADYSQGELEQRCNFWDATATTHSYLEESCESATPNDAGTFNPITLLDNNQVQDCDNCAYNGCTDQCPP